MEKKAEHTNPTISELLPLEYENQHGVVWLAKRDANSNRYGLFQTSGELKPTASVADLYWMDVENGTPDVVRQLAKYLVTAVNYHERLKEMVRDLTARLKRADDEDVIIGERVGAFEATARAESLLAEIEDAK